MRSGVKIVILAAVSVFFLLIFSPAQLFAADLKIAHADVIRIFEGYNKTKEQNKILEEETNKEKQQRDGMVMQIRKMKDEMDVLSQAAKEKKQAEIDEKIKQLQEFDQRVGLSLRQKQENVMRDILKEIEQIVEKYAQDNGYTMIINTRTLVYSQKQNDITDKILEILNSKAKNK
ncbi:MAG: OmpH family outer membrane protein [Candidatus Omnitrophica bacterium]|nr:OmpH family outer membrane protein [Candidatus Omnitrophota bacterium]